MPAGRPRSIKSAEELTDTFDAYIAEQEVLGLTPYKSHFLRKCGLYKDLLNEYNKNYEKEFSGALKYIDRCCEADIAKNMLDNKANYGAGKFTLMNNYGWRDKSQEAAGTTIIINDKTKDISEIPKPEYISK